MVNIKHLQPCRRKHHRIQVPIWIHVGDHKLELVDWSLGGFRAVNIPEELLRSDGFVAMVTLPFQGFCVSFDAPTRVVRRGPQDGEVALQFTELSDRARRLLDCFARALMSGEMTPVDGVIRGNEAPVGLLQSPVQAMPAPALSPWQKVRPRVQMGGYIAVGAVLAFFLGARLYQNVWRLHTSSASVVAPTEVIQSPVDGVLSSLNVQEGDRITAREPLFRVEAPDLMGALTSAELEVDEAELVLREAERALEIGRQKLAIHGDVVRTNLRMLNDQAKLVSNSLSMVSGQVVAAKALVEQNVLSPMAMEQDQSRADELGTRLAAVQGQADLNRRALRAAQEGYYYQGDRLEGGIPELSSAVDAAKDRLDLKRRQLDALKRQVTQMQEVDAPFTGRVSAVLQSEGTTVRKGNSLLVLTQDQVRRVEAWLSNTEAAYLRIGDTALVDVPTVDNEYLARITAVDTDPADAKRVFMQGDEAKTRVVLEIVGPSEEESEEDAGVAMQALLDEDPVGLPATVTFRRTWH